MLELRLTLGFTSQSALDAVRQILAEAHHNETERVVNGALIQVRYEEQPIPFNLICLDGNVSIPKTTLSISSPNVCATVNRIVEILAEWGYPSWIKPGLEGQTCFVLCHNFDGWAIFVHPSHEELEGG